MRYKMVLTFALTLMIEPVSAAGFRDFCKSVIRGASSASGSPISRQTFGRSGSNKNEDIHLGLGAISNLIRREMNGMTGSDQSGLKWRVDYHYSPDAERPQLELTAYAQKTSSETLVVKFRLEKNSNWVKDQNRIHSLDVAPGVLRVESSWQDADQVASRQYFTLTIRYNVESDGSVKELESIELIQKEGSIFGRKRRVVLTQLAPQSPASGTEAPLDPLWSIF